MLQSRQRRRRRQQRRLEVQPPRWEAGAARAQKGAWGAGTRRGLLGPGRGEWEQARQEHAGALLRLALGRLAAREQPAARPRALQPQAARGRGRPAAAPGSRERRPPARQSAWRRRRRRDGCRAAPSAPARGHSQSALARPARPPRHTRSAASASAGASPGPQPAGGAGEARHRRRRGALPGGGAASSGAGGGGGDAPQPGCCGFCAGPLAAAPCSATRGGAAQGAGPPGWGTSATGARGGRPRSSHAARRARGQRVPRLTAGPMRAARPVHISAAGASKATLYCRVFLLDGTEVSVDLPVSDGAGPGHWHPGARGAVPFPMLPSEALPLYLSGITLPFCAHS